MQHVLKADWPVEDGSDGRFAKNENDSIQYNHLYVIW